MQRDGPRRLRDSDDDEQPCAANCARGRHSVVGKENLIKAYSYCTTLNSGELRQTAAVVARLSV